MTSDPLQIIVDDTWEMKKTHVCGGNEWKILRVGLDIGMKCVTCEHRILITRKRFSSRSKKRINVIRASSKSSKIDK